MIFSRKKKTIISCILLISITLLAGCQNTGKSADDVKVGDTRENMNESQEAKTATDKQLAFLNKTIKETLASSFRYDKSFGTYFSDRSETEVVPRDISKEALQEKVRGYRYYEIQKDDTGSNKLTKYYITQDEKNLSDALENTDLKTKGLYNVYKDKYTLYNENVYFGGEDTEKDNPTPVMREFYSPDKLIKEGGAGTKSGAGVVTNRLPDEPVMVMSLINTLPLKDLVNAGTKTGYFKDVVTSDGMSFYTLVRNSSTTMFANELLKNLVENKETMKKYSDELTKYGIDITKKNNEKLNQEYVGRTSTLENLLRTFFRDASNKGYFENMTKYEEAMKKDNFDTRLPLGSLLKDTYEGSIVPYDNTVTGLTIMLQKDDSGKDKLSWISMEKVYNNLIGDLTRYVFYYTQDDDTKMLNDNMNSIQKIDKFGKKLNPEVTAQMRLLQVPSFVNKLTSNISKWTLYQNYFENLRFFNSESLIGELTPDKLKKLNGLNEITVTKENPTDKVVDWLYQFVYLAHLEGKDDSKDVIKTYTGNNSSKNDFKVNVKLVNPLKFVDAFAYEDVNGKPMKVDFKEGSEKDVYISKFIENAAAEMQAAAQTAKDTQGTKDANSGTEVEGKVLEDKITQERKTSPFKDAKLMKYKDAESKDAFASLSGDDGGYLDVLKRMYNKDISNTEGVNGGKSVKLITKNDKPTILVYSDISCPFCKEMYKVIGQHYDEITKEFNLVIFNNSNYAEDVIEYHNSLDEFKNESFYKGMKKLFDNNIYFQASELYGYMDPSYKPTVMVADKNGVIVNVTTGVTTDGDLNHFLEVIRENLKIIDGTIIK